MGLSEKYRKSLESQWFLRLKTSLPDGDEYDGIVTHNRKRFVVLRDLAEFAADGIQVLPKKHLVGYRDAALERCANAVLQGCALLRELRPYPWLDEVSSFHDLFRELQTRQIWPGVEMVFNGREGSFFYVGSILQADPGGFAICGYDAVGKWEPVYRLRFSDLARVTIGDSYTTEFNRYMRKHGAKELEKLRREYKP